MNDIVNTQGNGNESRFHLAEVTKHLTEMEKVEAGIAELKKELGGVVFDVKTPEGMKAAIAARARVRTPRLEVEKIRKAAKAPLNELGRDVDGRAKSITKQLEDIEDPIDAQIQAEQTRKENERLARVELERQRVAGIREAIDAIPAQVASLVGAGSVEIEAYLLILSKLELDPDFFQEYLEEVEGVKSKSLESLRAMLDKQLDMEARERQILADRQELERLQNAERERLAEEERQRTAKAAQEAREANERREAQERADKERRAAEDAAAEQERARKAAEQNELLRQEREQEDAARRAREAAEQEERERKGREMQEAADRRQKELDQIENDRKIEAERMAAEKAELEQKRIDADEADRLERVSRMELNEAAAAALYLLEQKYESTDVETRNLRDVLNRMAALPPKTAE